MKKEIKKYNLVNYKAHIIICFGNIPPVPLFQIIFESRFNIKHCSIRNCVIVASDALVMVSSAEVVFESHVVKIRRLCDEHLCLSTLII